MIAYSSVPVVLQVVVRDSPALILDSVGHRGHSDLVIATERESAARGMLGGGRGAGKINVNWGLSDATAKLKRYICMKKESN